MNDSTTEKLTQCGYINLTGRTPEEYFRQLRQRQLGWFELVIPIICCMGIIGNILNLIVLTRKRLLTALDSLERCANNGLVALALSDMLFCVSALPSMLLPLYVHRKTTLSSLALNYMVYSSAVINTFMMSSTWLIVSMAINRYIVVVYPLLARNYVRIRRTHITLTVVFLLSTLLTLPYYVRYRVTSCVHHTSGQRLYYLVPVWSTTATKALGIYSRRVWPVFASFIPLVVLLLCNIRLIYELRKAVLVRRANTGGRSVRKASHRVTLTLIVIVLMYIFFVSPSELLKYASFPVADHLRTLLIHLCNTLQACNFAFNFVLYCVVNATFRDVIIDLGKTVLCWATCAGSRCCREQDEGYSPVSQLQKKLACDTLVGSTSASSV